jgi:alpha-tubulin suppressor-like RCC1 family protein
VLLVRLCVAAIGAALLLTACGGGNGEPMSARAERPAAQHAAQALSLEVSSEPADEATSVAVDTSVRIRFSQPILASTVGPSTVRLVGPQGAVQGSYLLLPDECGAQVCPEDSRTLAGPQELLFRPSNLLQHGLLYTIEVAGVRAAVNGKFAPRYQARFTTLFEQAQPRDITVGGASACSVVPDAEQRARVKCWGLNSAGQLGLDDESPRGDSAGEMGANLPFVKLPLLPDDPRHVVQVTAGDGGHACVLLDDGSVLCWGNNQYGQLGRGDKVTPVGVSWNPMSLVKPVSLPLVAGDRVISVTAGSFSTCALTQAGHVFCWGRNDKGELGLGDTQHHGDEPGEIRRVELGDQRRALQLSIGQWHRCALLDDGALKCWGRNMHGQLGLSDALDRGASLGDMGDQLPAVDLGSGRRALQVSAGALHTCALLNTGAVACWGSNMGGRLGLGFSTTDTASPLSAWGDQASEMGDALPTIALSSGAGAVRGLSVGYDHSCARFASGKLQCWGLNYVGQLGLGDTHARGDQVSEMGDSLPPVWLGVGRSVVAISAGGAFGCARLDDGSLKCWGGNAYGQLGLGHTLHQGDAQGEMEQLAPVAVD